MTTWETDSGDVLAAGASVGGFTVRSVLGAGGFGVTYLAWDERLAKLVAVKEYFPREWAARRGDGTLAPRTGVAVRDYRWGLSRFLDEARALAKFDDRRIVRVHQFFESRGTAYLVLEHVEGRSLAEELEAAGAMPEARVRLLLDGLAVGLELVHGADLLHRDVKPSNVMLRGDGTPVLIDFGSARYALGAQSRSVTSLVTPGYAPIEQYRTDGEQGPWTDVYGLGALAYASVCGKPPADAPSRVGKVDPLVPVGSVSGVSDGFARAVSSALALFPEDRPQSVSAWRELLAAGGAVESAGAVVSAPADGGRSADDESAEDGVVPPPVQSPVVGSVLDLGVRDDSVMQPPSGTSGTPDHSRGSLAWGLSLIAGGALVAGVLVTIDRMDSGQGLVDYPPRPNPVVNGDSRNGSESGEGPDGTPTDNPPPDDGTQTGGLTLAAIARLAETAENALNLDRETKRRVQVRLSASGFDPGGADGIFGARTRAAIRAWEGANERMETGYLSQGDLDLLLEELEQVRVTGDVVNPPPPPPGRPAHQPADELRVTGDVVNPPPPPTLPYSPELGRRWSATSVEDNGWTDLHYAAVLNLDDIARRLLAEGAAVDARLPSSPGELIGAMLAERLAVSVRYPVLFPEGQTPLHIASAGNAVDVIEVLLDGNAGIGARTQYGKQPLHHAAGSEAFQALELLLDRGANIHARSEYGGRRDRWTPLHEAVSIAWSRGVVLLLDRGADVNVGRGDITPLHVTTITGSTRAIIRATEVAEILLDRGADVDARDRFGDTPLHAAAEEGNRRLVEVLLAYGADSDARNGDGRTPEELTGNVRIRALLGADPSPGECSRQLGRLSGWRYTRNDTLDGSCVTEHYPEGEYAVYYGFTLDRAATVTMDMASAEVDSWLALRSGPPPGSAVALEEDDDGGPEPLDARIARFLDAGSYTIEATTLSAGETGDFTLTVTVDGDVGSADDQCSRQLGRLSGWRYTRNDTLDGSCVTEHYPEGEYAVYYGFTLDRAATVTMDMASAEVDSWLALRSGPPPGSAVALEEDDDGGPEPLDARIARFLDAGSYTIEATTLSAGETGDFTLTVTVDGDVGSADDQCSRQLGRLSGWRYTRNDTLDGSCVTEHYPEGEYAVYYGFTLDRAATVTMDMASAEVDSWLALRSGPPPGSAVALEEDDDGGPEPLDARIARFLDAGSYTIEATTLSAGETGDFTLTVTVDGDVGSADDHGDLEATATRVALGRMVPGSIDEGGDVDYFAVEVASAGTLTVRTMGGMDTVGGLYYDGASLDFDDDDGDGSNFEIRQRVSPGTYYVRASGFLSATGSYRFQAILGY